MVEAVQTNDYAQDTQSKIIGFASLWLYRGGPITRLTGRFCLTEHFDGPIQPVPYRPARTSRPEGCPSCNEWAFRRAGVQVFRIVKTRPVLGPDPNT